MKHIAEHLLAAIALIAVLAGAVQFCITFGPQPTDHQARLWTATLDPCHRVSGQPWQAEVAATSYERARATAKERMQWTDKGFCVAPVVDNYLDVRQMRVTP